MTGLLPAWWTQLTVLWQGHAENRLLLVFQVRHHLSQSAQPLVDLFHLQTEQAPITHRSKGSRVAQQ